MKNKLIREIKKNKFKIMSFLIGYLIIITDFKLLNGIENIFMHIDKFYLILVNLFIILISYFILKKVLIIYLDILILKNDKIYKKIIKYFMIASLGSFIGFISLLFQSFILVLLPF